MSQQAGVRGVPQPETFRKLLVNLPLFDDLPRWASLVRRQHLSEPGAGTFMNFKQFLAFICLFIAATAFRRNRDAALIRYNPDRFRKCDSLGQHHKLEYVSPGLAAEAIE